VTESRLHKNKRESDITLTVIVPFYNEEESAPHLIGQILHVFSAKALRTAGISELQCLFVDDGSRDGGTAIFASALKSGQLKGSILRLSRNFGHQAAVAAGLDHCTGDVAAIIDADLQDSPVEILGMLERWRSGADVVYGVRRKRKEALWKRSAYAVFYRLLGFLSEGLIPDDSGDFCLIDVRVVSAIRSLPEHLRFFRGLRAWVGFNQVEHPYERDSRVAGSPKYTFRKLYKLATDGIASSSIRPLRLTQVCCIGSFLFSALCVVFSVYRLANNSDKTESLIVLYVLLAALGILGFFILLSLYIMSAYLGRMFIEVKARPSYIVSECLHQ
jgi:dolichol-phosphate mannosyltransferase